MRCKPLGVVLTLAALAGTGYLAFAVARTRAFRERRLETPHRLPSVAVLKPLHGDECQLEENLRSFCEQDYPAFEVIFGVRDRGDAAASAARNVVAEYPDRARLVTGDGAAPAAGNPKVANLMRMASTLSGEIVVIADADMRASPQYLRALVAPFEDPGVGAVTCLYAGQAVDGIESQLAAMFVNEQFAPSVLVAGAIEPLGYAFGATIAVRRSVLEAFGGFAALAAHVADDHLLGRLVTNSGLRIHLSRYVIQNVMAEHSFRSLWLRELRWSRTIRAVRPLGHALSFVTFGFPLALAAAIVNPCRLTRTLLIAAGYLRIALRRETNAAFGVRPKTALALVPFRDLLSLCVWAAAFFDRKVDWRGESLSLDPEGNILTD